MMGGPRRGQPEHRRPATRELRCRYSRRYLPCGRGKVRQICGRRFGRGGRVAVNAKPRFDGRTMITDHAEELSVLAGRYVRQTEDVDEDVLNMHEVIAG